ncbi:TPA: hypothetical protein U9J56_001681 [Acinetobacter baumannii]|nr:hypothetical protein [Acinetobacter baumannii]
MYKVKPMLISKDISPFLVLSLCIVLIVNFYFLVKYKNEMNQLILNYNQLINDKDNDFSIYENQSLDFYQEIDQIMQKKESGISIEKISLTPKITLIYGNSTNISYINIFKNSIGDKFILKKVNEQKDLYYFELEKKYE